MTEDRAGVRTTVMADVARLAGVSHQTVSRVINDSPHVRPETRERVIAAMEKLDYRPNTVARALVTGRSMTLGVVSFDTTLYGPASTLFGIERAAHAAGYFVSIVEPRVARCGRPCCSAIDRLRDQGVDGIVVIAPQVARPRARCATCRRTCRSWPSRPAAGRRPGRRRRPVRRRAAATRAPARARPPRPCHLAGPPDWLEAQQRVAGWRGALAPRAPGAARRCAATGARARATSSAGALADDPDVTAVFVANDQMALGLLRALHEAGRDVPGDVSVVGFDDIPESAYFTPPLTTVRQDFNEIGRRSLALLLRRMAAATQGEPSVMIQPSLVLRSSTGPAVA